MLDNFSNIYSMGVGDSGELGHGNLRSYSQPRVIEKLAQCLAITENILGSNSNESNKFQPTSLNSSMIIVQKYQVILIFMKLDYFITLINLAKG
jgi:hypothetical protein